MQDIVTMISALTAQEIIIALILILVIFLILKQLVFIFREWIKIKIANYLKKREELKQLRKLEKEAKAHRYISLDNWLLLKIIEARIITIEGDLGKGKTLIAMIIAKFLLDKFDYEDIKNHDYNIHMKPKLIAERQKLRELGVIPVNTNMKGVKHPVSGFPAMDNVIDVLYQRVRAPMPSVQVIDEFGKLFPKEKYFEMLGASDEDKKEYDEVKESFRLARKRDGWIIGTEQTGNNRESSLRNSGTAMIKASGTKKYLLPIGKAKQKSKMFVLKNFPGWLVSKPKFRFRECLFPSQFVSTFFKLVFCRGWRFRKQFYISRDQLYETISRKYLRLDIWLEYDNKKYLLTVSKNDFLEYDTLEQQADYLAKFDEDGNRKKEKVKVA